MYVNVIFVIRRWYSAVGLTLVREQRFIKNIIMIICSGEQGPSSDRKCDEWPCSASIGHLGSKMGQVSGQYCE